MRREERKGRKSWQARWQRIWVGRASCSTGAETARDGSPVAGRPRTHRAGANLRHTGLDPRNHVRPTANASVIASSGRSRVWRMAAECVGVAAVRSDTHGTFAWAMGGARVLDVGLQTATPIY